MNELLPCPFCGGEAHTIEPARYGKSWGVRCECGAFLGFELTEAEAVEAWNTRAERTCHEVMVDKFFRGCSECGYMWEYMYGIGKRERPNHCPNCGARVVE